MFKPSATWEVGLLVAAALLAGGPVFAAPPPTPAASGAVSEVTEAELAERLAFYRKISQLDVDFKQTKWMSDMGIRLPSEGRLSLRKPDVVTWQILRPSPLVVRMDRAQIRIESGTGAEKSTQEFKLADLPNDRAARAMGSLVAWLSMDAHRLSGEYRVSRIGARKYRFEPRQPEQAPFTRLEMQLSTPGYLQGLTIDEVSRDRIEIEFAKPRVK